MRLCNEENSKIFTETINNMKTISGKGVEQESLKRFLLTIDVINSLPRFTKVFGDEYESISEWQIPTMFKGLIYPSEVTVSGKFEAIDFLVKPFTNKNEAEQEVKTTVMSQTEFQAFSIKIAAQFRLKDATSGITRTPLMLGETADLAIVNKMVKPGTRTRIPFELSVQLEDEVLFNQQQHVCLTNYIISEINNVTK